MADDQRPIVANLPDGTRLNFPAGTPDDVVDRAVAEHLSTAPKNGVTANRELEQTFPQRTPEPHVHPNSPRDVLERGSEAVFGRFAPMVNAGVVNAARNLPGVGGLAAQALDEGSPVGGMVGGTVGGLLGGVPGGLGGSAVGGAGAGYLERWFRGEPTTPGNVAWDAGSQGALQAAAPAIGSTVKALAGPMYKMALRPGSKIAAAFGDVAKRGLEEGLPVNAKSIPKAEASTTASRAKAMQMVTDAEAAGAPNIPDSEFQDAMKPVFEKARNQARGGSVPPIDRLMDRSRTISQTAGPHGVTPTGTQTLKETWQDEATRIFDAIDKGGHVSSLDDEAVKDLAVAAQKGLETSTGSVGMNVGPQNLNTKELLGLVRALKQAENRHLAGSGGNVVADLLGGGAGAIGGLGGGPGGAALGAGAGIAASRLIRAAGPNAMSRAAIGMDRAGKFGVEHGAKMANAARILAMMLRGEDDTTPHKEP